MEISQKKTLIENKSLKIGMFIMFKNCPCEIIDLQLSTNKFVHKIFIKCKNIFTKEIHEDILNVNTPFSNISGCLTEIIKLKKTQYITIKLEGNMLWVLDEHDKEISIELSNNDFCDEISKYCKHMEKICNIEILSYQNMHKITRFFVE